MESIESLIPDGRGNHLVVVLYFYDDLEKRNSFMIPSEFNDIEIADINIHKVNLDAPLAPRAFFSLCRWLMEQFQMYPNVVFSFICSTDDLETRHDIEPELYRWKLFDVLHQRSVPMISQLSVNFRDIIVGPIGYKTHARVYYRDRHASIINLVTSHLADKYETS